MACAAAAEARRASSGGGPRDEEAPQTTRAGVTGGVMPVTSRRREGASMKRGHASGVRAGGLLTAWLLAVSVAPARGAVQPGQTAPNFTKSQLGGGSVSLSNYSGKVVVLFLLGYS